MLQSYHVFLTPYRLHHWKYIGLQYFHRVAINNGLEYSSRLNGVTDSNVNSLHGRKYIDQRQMNRNIGTTEKRLGVV